MNANSTRQLHTGREIPIMGLGTWQLTGDNAAHIISYGLQLGYRLIDTSGDYRNQAEIGRGIKDGDIGRENIYLVTKVEENEDAYQSTKSDLKELDQEYADLMLIHRPPPQGAGIELWEGLIKAREDGLTKDIGVSNYTIEQMQTLADATGEMPVVNQIEWSPFGYSQEMLDFCQDHDIVIMAYSPLTHMKKLHEDIIVDLSDKYERTEAQILIRWSIQHGCVPIPKASTKEHVEENFNVFDFKLNTDDMARLDALNQHYSTLGSTLAYV